MKEGAMMTVLSTLVASFALPATLVTASDLIDSKWAIAVDRLVFILLEGRPTYPDRREESYAHAEVVKCSW
jgi:hypothetical protein